MFKDTSGGLEPREVTDEAVKPIGSPSLVADVTTVMPEAWLRKTDLRASEPCRSKLRELSFISR
jgi:hypothetical protein